MTNALPCIVCGARLQNVFPDGIRSDDYNQPSDGTAFDTFGHYGSTFFDPMDGSRIEINVCDPCLVKNIDKMTTLPPTRVVSRRSEEEQLVDGSEIAQRIVETTRGLLYLQLLAAAIARGWKARLCSENNCVEFVTGGERVGGWRVGSCDCR